VHFLWTKGLNTKVYIKMLPVYVGKCLSLKAVRKWVEKFYQRSSTIADNARPGRPVEIATETAVQRLE
jgi:transposase